MASIYHPGEIAVQARAGSRELSKRVGKSIRSVMPPIAREFLLKQRMVAVGSVDANGRVWASLLTGPPGFLRADDEQTVWIEATPVAGDPLGPSIQGGAPMGLSVVEFSTRRRAQVTGHVEALRPGGLSVRITEIHSNCPKYIQARQIEADPTAAAAVRRLHRGETLTEAQERWITLADTFFIASFHPEGGADVAHRGGKPGFVKALAPGVLIFPDYAGNRMFHTLGNITENPSAGLLFIDFERGATLQMTGTASVIWESERVEAFAGAERLVEFRIEEAIEIAGAGLLSTGPVEYSPANPA